MATPDPTSSARVRLVGVGVVLGLLIAGVIAFVAWPDGDGDGHNARSAGSSHEQDQGHGGGDKDISGLPAPKVPARQKADLPKLDLAAANRRAPTAGLPDWSHAGYRGGRPLPTDADITTDQGCRIMGDELGGEYGVTADDGKDDTAGLQKAIDTIKKDCSPKAGFEKLSLIQMPQGEIDVSKQISVDADYLILRGAGSDPATGTRLVFRPDQDTRYDTLTKDGSQWDQDEMTFKDGKGGWLWPGRGLFRVQSRAVDQSYRKNYDKAPVNRRDLFEGTVNVHWKAGQTLREAPSQLGFAAKAGDTVVYLDDKADMENLKPGGWVNIRAANSMKFYEQQHAVPTRFELQNLHMRQQIFGIKAADTAAHTITLDKPLEFDVPVDSTSDGSEEIEGKTFESKASPLVDPVVGVGFEHFHFGEVIPGGDPAKAVHEYGNLAPAYAMHGIVFKWAVDGWVRDTASYMTGSHPVVTEEAKNLEVVDNYFEGAWNKGKGGNGYVRGSRVWDSLYAGNVMRNLRHSTFQWSASDNVFIGNDTDSDLNMHGGWERNNLFERNVVHVPFEHRPGNCTANCGGEAGSSDKDDSQWYPIWWGAGQKAVKWSGASGPRNVFFANTLTKQLAKGGPYTPYRSTPGQALFFGWDGKTYHHLDDGGSPIKDWAGHETDDLTGITTVPVSGPSLFLKT